MRPYKRFLDTGVEGVDPTRQFSQIVMKDFNSLDSHRRRSRQMAKSNMDSYPSPYSNLPSKTVLDLPESFDVMVPPLTLPGAVVGTTKCTYRRGMLEQATGRINRNALGIEALSFPRNPTDNVT